VTVRRNQPREFSRADELLQAREARVLTWSLAARLAAIAVSGGFSFLHLAGVARGIVTETEKDAAVMLAMSIASAVVISYGLVLSKREKHLRGVGLGAVLLDITYMAALPVIWFRTVTHPDAGFLMKGELFLLGSVTIVVNSLTLRPLYPALMAGGAIAVHLAVMGFVMADPRVALTKEFMDHFLTPAVNPGLFYLRILILALEGVFLAFLAKTARQTIRDAVNLEVSNLEIKERQAELILDGKMAALSGLVAGVAHEVNTPLGVLRSSLDTSESAASKLAEKATAAGGGSVVERMIRVMEENGRVARQAVARIVKIVSSLKDFSRLDEAELQPADLRAGLDTALSLIEPDKKGRVDIVKEYEDVPEIVCRPKELNQVFMTVLVNAFEVMDGEGTLRLSTSLVDDRIAVKIADTGPGIPAERLASLFEIGFASTKGRVSMGLGLPIGRRIVERHGGALSVESEPGKGTAFTISLPV
jgi:signal transduction histidine kinase